MTDPFLNSRRELRNGWWIMTFLVVLAMLLLPTILLAQANSRDVSMGVQAGIIALASLICQLLRREPAANLLGKFDVRWSKELWSGGLIGIALMLIPAFVLGIFGWVHWQWNSEGVSTLLSSLLLHAGVAAGEELLFRGFVFQRLLSGLGQWSAQLIVAVFFLLTHLNNPGMAGGAKVMASTNVFLASILFGLAFIKTRSLAMPLGLHWMANWIQGGMLGFGVSGTQQAGLLRPVFGKAPAWLTGAQFGLEASMPGLICLGVTLVLLFRWGGSKEPSNGK